MPFGLKVRARASAERKDGKHTGRILVFVPRPSLLLLAHEADHILTGIKAHHHWAHFCGRVGHALRRSAHLHPEAMRCAGDLLAFGYTASKDD